LPEILANISARSFPLKSSRSPRDPLSLSVNTAAVNTALTSF
jgi:hypothetical protein